MRTVSLSQVSSQEQLFNYINVANVPLSREDASEMLSDDYAAYVLGLSDWNMRVMIQLTDESIKPQGNNLGGFVFVPVIFTIELVRPFDFVFN